MNALWLTDEEHMPDLTDKIPPKNQQSEKKAANRREKNILFVWSLQLSNNNELLL